MNEKTLAIIVKAKDEASKVMDDIGGKIASAMKTATVAVGAAGIAFAAFSLKSAADFQQTRIGLENMLGSADKAKILLSDISKFAAETPFEFPELAQATRQLVAFGFSADDAFKTMKQLGDVSAAVGAPINDLAYLMGTLRTQGRAFTVDIRQFAQRGIPIYEYLAKVLGTTEQKITEMIEAGKIGFPEVEKAFQAMTAEGGKFHGTMEKQSKSLSGLFSTLTDNIGQAGRELLGISTSGDIAEGSALDRLGDILTEVTQKLPELSKQFQETVGGIIQKATELGTQISDYLAPKFGALWTAVNENLIPALQDLWHNVIEPLAPVIGQVLVGALGAVVDILTLMVQGFGYVYDKLKEGDVFWWTLIGVLGTVATALTLNAAFTAFTAGMTLIQTVTIPAVIAQFTALSALLLTPITLPALAIGAVLVGLWAIRDAAFEAMDAIQAAKNAESYNEISNDHAKRQLQNLAKNGTPEQKERANAQLKRLYATGTTFAPGGMAWVGEHGPELVDLPRGSKVHSNKQSEQMASSSVFNMYGNFIVDSEARIEQVVARINNQKEMGSLGVGI